MWREKKTDKTLDRRIIGQKEVLKFRMVAILNSHKLLLIHKTLFTQKNGFKSQLKVFVHVDIFFKYVGNSLSTSLTP